MRGRLAGWWWATVWMSVLAVVAGCGGGGPDVTKANVRLVNASSGYALLDMLVDDARRFSSVGFGSTATYVEVDPDATASSITLPGATTALVSLTPALSRKNYYTVLAFGAEGALKAALLPDNTDPDNDKTLVRVFNGATDAGAVDVYLTGPAESLASAVALQGNAAVGAIGTFATLSPATLRLWVTAAGDKSKVLLDTSGVVFSKGQVVTIVVTSTAGGVLVNALMLNQEGSVSAIANAQARVRVAAPNTGTVTAVVGNRVVLAATEAPAVGAYQLLSAGAQQYQVQVDSVTLPETDVTLGAGTEQTLLVLGEAGTPTAVWIADDNRLPASTGNARVRLVHGLQSQAGALSMKADLLPVATDVALGTASPYGLVAVNTKAGITITAAGASAPLVQLTDQVIEAGGVYSVFIVAGSSPATPQAFLRRDR